MRVLKEIIVVAAFIAVIPFFIAGFFAQVCFAAFTAGVELSIAFADWLTD